MRATRTATSTGSSRLREYPIFPSITRVDSSWHARAIRDATVVRRVVRNSSIGGRGVVGIAGTTVALQQNTIQQVLLTPRFRERHPQVADLVDELARSKRFTTHVVSGAAALNLDLIGDGIAAILLRPTVPESGPDSVRR